MNILTKILFIVLAIIILILGFFVGAFILTAIFVLLVLMTLLFVVIWLFNNLINLFRSNLAKLGFKSIFSLAVTYGIITVLWMFASEHFLQMSKILSISSLWLITTVIFGTLWYLLHIKKQAKKHQYLWDDYKNSTNTLSTWDAIMIVVMPSLIIYVFNAVHLII